MFPKAKFESYRGYFLPVPSEVTVYADSELSCSALDALRVLISDADVNLIRSNSEFSALLVLSYSPDASEKSGFYKISADESGVRCIFNDRDGAFRCAASLVGLVKKEYGQLSFPICELEDYPDCSFRGLMLDPARRLIPIDEIKRTIFNMALAKMNVLHLHLMDSDMYAIHSDALPRLNVPVRECYSHDDIRELVAYAARLGIDILPEIELTTHATFIISRIPELACETESVKPSNWAVCLGADRVYEIFEKLINEIASLFPYEVLHIGTDEIANFDDKLQEYCMWPTWFDCKHCRETAEKHHIHLATPEEASADISNGKAIDNAYAGLEELFILAVNRIYKIVKAAGKRMMMWNDYIDISKSVDLPRDILIHFWRVAARGRGPVKGCSMARFLEEGFEVVNSHYQETYIEADFYRAEIPLNEWSPALHPPVDPKYRNRVLGGIPTAWGNYTHFDYTLPSSLSLYAERFWNEMPCCFDKAYNISMTRMLLGPETPEGYDVFSPLGGVLLPRDHTRYKFAVKDKDDGSYRYGYVNRTTSTEEETRNSIKILEALSKKDTVYGKNASAYLFCTKWMLNKRFSVE